MAVTVHLLFVHQNFPAQFGHIARYLVRERGFRCSFVTHYHAGGRVDGLEVHHYELRGGATARTHYCTRTFENAVAHAHGVYESLKPLRDLRPDLIIGHSGFGSTLFLRELFLCPVINYFEYYYRPHGSDLDFRPQFPPQEMDVLRSYCRNAMLQLDLENCDAGYSPTEWQRSRFPTAYQPKIDVIFDGVDTDVWHRRSDATSRFAPLQIPAGTRVITYVSRGFESMRGFDVFMQFAKRVYQQYPQVRFLCVGTDRVAYGGDQRFIKARSFREHVLAQDEYDLSKFHFLGRLSPDDLARVLSLSDLHVYLTVPFVLSWSLFDALACGCTVLASDTEPVRELITQGQNGLLAGFFDAEGLAEQALQVLRRPDNFRHLAENGQRLIRERYALDCVLPRMLSLYERVAQARTG